MFQTRLAAKHRGASAALGLALVFSVVSTPATAAWYVKIIDVAPGHVLWLHSGDATSNELALSRTALAVSELTSARASLLATGAN